jgi:hypothetical protein
MRRDPFIIPSGFLGVRQLCALGFHRVFISQAVTCSSSSEAGSVSIAIPEQSEIILEGTAQ